MSSITPTRYGLSVRLELPYEEAMERVTAALKDEGFGVLTEIDVKATLKKKIDAEFRRYVILGACNPRLAHRALGEELEIGMLLPCNVVVYEDGEGSMVAAADPKAMMEFTGNPALEGVAAEARERIERALSSL